VIWGSFTIPDPNVSDRGDSCRSSPPPIPTAPRMMPRWDCVDVRAVRPFETPVTLQQIKATDALSEMALVKSMRLSVQPVTDPEWDLVCTMGNTKP